MSEYLGQVIRKWGSSSIWLQLHSVHFSHAEELGDLCICHVQLIGCDCILENLLNIFSVCDFG